MNALVPLPAVTTLPPPSAALEACLRPSRYRSPIPDEGDFVVALPLPGRLDVQEARKLLPAYEAWCRPPSSADRGWQEQVVSWLVRIALGVGNPPGEDDIRARAVAIADACQDLPRSVWCDATVTLGRQQFQWWGNISAPSVRTLLLDFAGHMVATRDNLRRVAAFQIEAPAESVEPADPDRIAELAREAKAHLADHEVAAAGPRPIPKALHLSDHGLLIEYQKIIDNPHLSELAKGPARTRADMLRRKLDLRGSDADAA